MQYYQNPKNSDINILLNSVGKVMEAVDNVFEFRVLGGEPFMNKEIGKIIHYLKKYEKVSQIVIYTNGTILPKNENLEELKDPKILMDITNYGALSKNHDRLIELLTKENIPFLTTIPKWTDSGRINYQKKSEDQLKFMFKNCCTNDYLTLLNGKLYRCPFSANAMNLHAIPINQSEFIDLEENFSREELRKEIIKLYYSPEFLTACNYCNGRDFTTPRIESALQTKTIIPIPEFENKIFL
jgi:organic radical activating enzyme